MNLQNPATILVSALFTFTLASSMSACGGDDSGSGDSGTAAGSTVATNTVATSAGGTTASSTSSSTSASSTADTTTATNAAGGTTSTTADSGSTSGGELPDDMCSGIGNGDACTTPGTCSGRVCGLADTGTRDCTCMDTWDCTSCAWSDPPPALVQQPAEPLTACDAAVADKVACETVGDLCEQSDEVCVCFDDDGEVIWDCDKAPSFWQ